MPCLQGRRELHHVMIKVYSAISLGGGKREPMGGSKGGLDSEKMNFLHISLREPTRTRKIVEDNLL